MNLSQEQRSAIQWAIRMSVNAETPEISQHHQTLCGLLKGGERQDIDYDGAFGTFWHAYPRKTAKETARKAFLKLKPSLETFRTIMTALAAQKKTEQWARDPQFIPHAATWLNQKRWEDEVQEAKPVRPTVVDEWWKTNQGIERRGRELGVQPGRMDWSAWRDAIFAAEKKLKGDAA